MTSTRSRMTAGPCTDAAAAPAGGARAWWGRGCALGIALAPGVPALAGDMVDVPSGQPVELTEVLLDDQPGETWARFRFIAPGISGGEGGVDYDMTGPDMDHLCQELALPYLAHRGLAPARVIISLADREVEFGATDPDATQVFEAYRLEDARCVWEGL